MATETKVKTQEAEMMTELTEQEEAENLAMAEALEQIATIVDQSESDPALMQRMLIDIYVIAARFN